MTVKETVAAAWSLPDLRARIIFVFAMFGVYALGLHVSVPGLSPQAVEEIVKNNILFQIIDTFGGGALRKVSIFSLGLNPYITASIIMQLMAVAIPSLQQMQKEGGEYGRRQINQITRKLTVILSILQGIGFAVTFSHSTSAGLSTGSIFTIVICWLAGAMFLLWLGEQMTEKGIGNGISMLIFAGIVARLPWNIYDTYQFARFGQVSAFSILLLIALFLATIWGVVMFTRAQRRIPIQHARRVIGSRQVGGQTTYLPLQVNTAGVIPIIFAISLLLLPQQFASMVPQGNPLHNSLVAIARWFTPGSSVLGAVLYTAMIFGFTYFYTAAVFNVQDIADNLKKHGAFVPGLRPGKDTRDYLDKVITRLTTAGAAFLAVIALMQYWVPALTNVQTFSLVGGTSLLIVVGVALDTMQQVEAQLLMRQYEGFIK